jgi:hypothetical protein
MRRWVVPAVAACAGIVALAAITLTVPTAREPTSESMAPSSAQAPQRPLRAPDGTLAAARGSAAPSTVVVGSLRQRVERLLSRGTTAARYQAFGVLSHCADARDFDRYLKSLPAGGETGRLRERYGDSAARIAAACGDLSARQVESRVELAASAADDGVPGAASAWIEEGPYGDRTALTQRPDDPLVVAWAEQAIARVLAATRRSDTEAISQFGLLCLNWELDDVSRVRLLVDAALEQRRSDQIRSVVN